MTSFWEKFFPVSALGSSEFFVNNVLAFLGIVFYAQDFNRLV